MRSSLFIFVTMLTCNGYAFWEAARGVSEKAADTSLIADSIIELSDSIQDEGELVRHLEDVSKTSSEFKKSLTDMGYTAAEIKEILSGSPSSYIDVAGSISRTARRINRGKALAKKVGLLTVASPEAVTATQTLEMNSSLRDIVIELQHQRLERMAAKDKERLTESKLRIEQKRKDAFFKKQFAMMEKRSPSGPASYFSFSSKSEADKQFGIFAREESY